MDAKHELRSRLRTVRRAHVDALPDSTRALLFMRPPRQVADIVPPGSVIGLYHATPVEAPAGGYAKFFMEAGHRLALPHFSGRHAGMTFRAWTDPYAEGELERGPFGMLQPDGDAPDVSPDVLVMPLVGFTADGHRLGQGGGHYDRWLADNPGRITIGLAWDCQLLDSLPVESHDCPLDAVVTPTRVYGPF